jgi:hypothetical protein
MLIKLRMKVLLSSGQIACWNIHRLKCFMCLSMKSRILNKVYFTVFKKTETASFFSKPVAFVFMAYAGAISRSILNPF